MDVTQARVQTIADLETDLERAYEVFKARLVAEAPGILEVLTIRPELIVRVQRQTITVDGETLRGRIAALIAGGFIDEAQTTSTVMAELSRRGFGTAAPNVSKELGELARMGFLTRDNKWYRAVADMRVNIVEAA